VQKQLQATIAVGSMTFVYGLESMKLKQVHQKLCYHGNPTSGNVAMVNDLLKGENAYTQLWDQSEDKQATVKSRFMQKNDALFYSGTHITVGSLSTAHLY